MEISDEEYGSSNKRARFDNYQLKVCVMPYKTMILTELDFFAGRERQSEVPIARMQKRNRTLEVRGLR